MYSPGWSPESRTRPSVMALVAYNAGQLALPLASELSAVTADTQLAIAFARQLGTFVKLHATTATVANITQAVTNLVKLLRPYVNHDNVAKFRSTVDTAVKSYWRSTGNSSKAVMAAPADFKKAVRALVPHFVATRATPARREIDNAIPFADIIRGMRRTGKPQLVGVEKNPGPKSMNNRGMAVAAAYGNRVVTLQPRITMGANGKSCRIRHRELYDASIPGSTAFAIQDVIQLNPGLDTTFPWLAPQARQWEQYVCHGLRVHVIAIAPTSTQGTIAVSPSYDASDLDPSTEQQLSNAVDTVEESVWKTFTVNLNPKTMMALGPRRFVRAGAQAGDIKTFDVGVIYIATNNCVGTDPVAKAWLEYDFEFFAPQNSPNFSGTHNMSLVQSASGVSFTNAVAKRLEHPANFPAGTNPLRIQSDPLNPGRWILPKGVYYVEAFATLIDPSNEPVGFYLWLYQGGVLMGTTLRQSWHAAQTGGNSASLTTSALIVVDDPNTDYVEIYGRVNGATGSLASVNSGIRFSLA